MGGIFGQWEMQRKTFCVIAVDPTVFYDDTLLWRKQDFSPWYFIVVFLLCVCHCIDFAIFAASPQMDLLRSVIPHLRIKHCWNI